MIYSGGFFSGEDFITAFSNSDASVGLMLGSAFALVFAFIYFLVRRSMSFKDMMSCIPEGFKAMVPAILILTFAWSLKAMTDSLGAKYFVRDFVRTSATGVQMLLPVIVFLDRLPAGLCHRDLLGHLRHPDPHRAERVLHERPHGHRLHLRLHGRRGVRRPLLPHL